MSVEVLFDVETNKEKWVAFKSEVEKLLKEKLNENQFDLNIRYYRGEGAPVGSFEGYEIGNHNAISIKHAT